MKTTFRAPRPAPYFASASAQAFASFCTWTGTLNASIRYCTIGTSSQPGRLGGLWMIPSVESSGPPHETPMLSIS